MAQHDDSGCRTIIGALWYPTHARDRLKISAGQGSDTSRRPDRDTRKKLSLPFAQAPRSQTDAKTLRAPGNSPTPPPYRRPLRHASNRGTRCDSPRLLQRGVYAAIHANRFDGMPPQCGTGNTRAKTKASGGRGGGGRGRGLKPYYENSPNIKNQSSESKRDHATPMNLIPGTWHTRQPTGPHRSGAP